MQFSTDEQHAHSLAMLREVRDYIASWPPHPMSRAMIKRIDEHLADPLRGLVARTVPVRAGGSYTPTGVPVLSAELVGAKLTVQVPQEGMGLSDRELLARLRAGETFDLRPEK